MSNSDEGATSQRQDSLFDVEKVPDEEELNGAFRNEHIICVELVSGSLGFGLFVKGGVDVPLHVNDTGIFVTKVKEGSAADKNKSIEVGDKILEVNGHSLANVNHAEAINYFRESGGVVKLLLHKHVGLLLEAASLSEEMDSPSLNPEELKGFSPVGFVVGIAIGCIAVLALRKYLMQR